jgi:hypothetical protein
LSSLLDRIREAELRNAETATGVSKKENTGEMKDKLKRYVEEIEKNYPDSYLKALEPEGAERGRSFDAELDLYRDAKADGREYLVHFSYPHSMEGDSDEKLKEKAEKLATIRLEVMAEENGALRDLVMGILSVTEAQIRHVFALRAFENNESAREERGDGALRDSRQKAKEDECFYWATETFGALDPDLVKRAKIAYAEKQRELSEEKKPSALEEVLLSNRFDAEDIVYEFNHFFEKAGMDQCLAVKDKTKKNCSTLIHSSKFEGKSVVKIPEKYDINSLKLIQLLNHEATHVITGEFQYRELGLGKAKFGPNAEAVKEGLAVLQEMEVSNEIFGTDRLRGKAHPYYVLAMEEVRRESVVRVRTANAK